jgi:hypothetical protein
MPDQIHLALSREEAEQLFAAAEASLSEDTVEHPAPYPLRVGRSKLRVALDQPQPVRGEGEATFVVDGKRMDANGVNEHGVAMCQCKPFGSVHAWEPGEWCGDRVVPQRPHPDPEGDADWPEVVLERRSGKYPHAVVRGRARLSSLEYRRYIPAPETGGDDDGRP